MGTGKVGEGNEQLDSFARFSSMLIRILLRYRVSTNITSDERKINVFHRNMRPVFILLLCSSVTFQMFQERHVQVLCIYHDYVIDLV